MQIKQLDGHFMHLSYIYVYPYLHIIVFSYLKKYPLTALHFVK